MGESISNIEKIVIGFRLLNFEIIGNTIIASQLLESGAIDKDEFINHIHHLFDDIEKQTKGDYKFYSNIEDRGMLDSETSIKHLRFDYISIHCDTIIIMFAAYLDSNTGAIKDLMQYFDYRIYKEKGDT